MASLISKKKGKQLYYYVVESARVNGQPRIVNQSYLGSAEKVAALVRDRTAPIPSSATMRDFGLPGALWLAAQQTGVDQAASAPGRGTENGRNSRDWSRRSKTDLGFEHFRNPCFAVVAQAAE